MQCTLQFFSNVLTHQMCYDYGKADLYEDFFVYNYYQVAITATWEVLAVIWERKDSSLCHNCIFVVVPLFLANTLTNISKKLT